MRAGPSVVLIDLLAAAAAGQRKRASAFLERVTRFDPDSHFIVLKEQGTLEGIEPRDVRLETVAVALPGGFWKPIARLLWQALHVRRLIARHRVTVFLTFSHFLPPGVACGSRIVGVSNVAPFSARAWRVASWRERVRLWLLRRSVVWSARRATHVLALSEHCKRLLVTEGIGAGTISVVRNGSDRPRLGESSAAHDPEFARPFVLSVSHFYSYKNFECVLQAFAALPADLRATYTLVLVGAPMDRRYHRRIVELAALLVDRIDVRIIPGLGLDRLMELYSTCAAFVFPSLVENCPNVLLEALSAGAPCVVSAAEPMREFADDAARYFDPDRPDELAQELATVLRTAALRESLRARALVVAERFTWDELVRGTVQAYRNPSREGEPLATPSRSARAGS